MRGPNFTYGRPCRARRMVRGKRAGVRGWSCVGVAGVGPGWPAAPHFAGAMGAIFSFSARISSMRRAMDSAGRRMRSTSACTCRATVAASGSFTNCRAHQASLAACGQLAAMRSSRSWGVNCMRTIKPAARRGGINFCFGSASLLVAGHLGRIVTPHPRPLSPEGEGSRLPPQNGDFGSDSLKMIARARRVKADASPPMKALDSGRPYVVRPK